MRLKYYLRGLGIGILVTALLFMALIVPEKKKMTDKEVIAAAEKLGMEMKKEDTLDLDNIIWESTPAVTVVASKIPELSKIPDAEATPEINAAITPLPTSTDDITPTNFPIPELTNRPTALPTKIPTPTNKPTALPTKIPTPTNKPTALPTKIPTPTNKPTALPTETPIDLPDGSNNISDIPEPTKKPEYITIRITAGMYSAEVSRLLYDKGLIKSAKDFDKFLMDKGYADRIKFNAYKIPVGASYQEIAEILTNKTYQIP